MSRPCRTMPADFRHFVAIETNDRLKVRYGCGSGSLARWRVEAGIAGRVQFVRVTTNYRSLPDDFAEMAGTMTRAELRAHYDCSEDLLRRFFQLTGAAPKPARIGRPFTRQAARPRAAAHYGQHKAYDSDSRDGGLHSRAQQYLQRLGPVYRCGDTGQADPRGAFYYVWGSVLLPSEMLARAERKGFQASSWAVAA